MVVTFVHVHVQESRINDFIQASLENHKNSVKEPGNLRFDLVQQVEEPARFVLYEAYESEEDAAAHKATEHYKIWRDTVADWMASPRQGIKHTIIAPQVKAGFQS